MRNKKTLQELTLKDNFLFGAVMMEEDNCKQFLEMVLGFPIGSVKVSKEKSIIYNPEYKGVRLDVFAKDKKQTCYNIEMQVLPKPALAKRSRYYHSQMDMEALLSGREYTELPNVYTIFVCDFDPFGKEKYCYTFCQRCLEEQNLGLEDGCSSIFLSTCGKNESDVSKKLIKFLRFVKADLSESTADFEDQFVKKLQESIQNIKQNRKMEERFMIMKEMLAEERAEGREEGKAEGKAEGILDLLSDLGTVPEELSERIMSEMNLEVLKKWLRCAARSESIEEFLNNM